MFDKNTIMINKIAKYISPVIIPFCFSSLPKFKEPTKNDNMLTAYKNIEFNLSVVTLK